MVGSASRSSFLFEHDLFGKPVSTFPDHALERGTVSAQEPGIKAMGLRIRARNGERSFLHPPLEGENEKPCPARIDW
jgi:hypothetical protein